MPIYGKGLQMREWLHVDDSAAALALIAERAQPGSRYNVGSGMEMRNIDVAKAVATLLDQISSKGEGSHHDLITYVDDRPGHDFRYALDSSKLCQEFDWAPAITLEAGLRETVLWYMENNPATDDSSDEITERRGLGAPTTV
jgi:dTDP-glucose 4,6-dehydratase